MGVKWNENRLEAFRASGKKPRFVPVRFGQYLLDALFVLGPLRFDGMGNRRPADWPEIAAFVQATGRVSEPWEIETLYDMAQAFKAGMDTGDKLFGIEPIDQFQA